MPDSSLSDLIINESKSLQPYLVKTRHFFHQHPELMYEENQTSRFIQQELQQLDLTPISTAQTGWVVEIHGDELGPVYALRADMDALPIQEENQTSYMSQYPGKMHACGHDAHMTALLGAARIISKFKHQLKGTVKLIFQPAEEGGGGAKKIVEEGHLTNVDQVYGIHVWEPLQSGKIGTCSGTMFAAADMFRIIIKGKGGHAAMPHLSVDPTVVATELYDAFQKLITREISPLHTTLITSPKIQGSDAGNVIPARAELTGTLRVFDLADRKYIITRMEQILDHYSKAWRCEAELTLLGVSYPPVVNDPEIYEQVRQIISPLGDLKEVDPTLGGEDFAFYVQEKPGLFLFLGIHNEKKGIIYPHHHPKFDIDEEVLWKGAALYSLLGLQESL